MKTAQVDPLLDEVAALLARLPRSAQRQAVRGLRNMLEAGSESARAPARRGPKA